MVTTVNPDPFQQLQLSSSLDGQNNSILFMTIKQIIQKAKHERMLENLKNINIKWEEFSTFSPIQIIGLYNLVNSIG